MKETSSMRMYITSRFKDAVESRGEIEALCAAVRAAGWEDFHFIRDIERFDPHHFSSQQEVWQASLRALRDCDALLIDVSDAPTGGRNVELGMAYALGMPIYVIARCGATYKSFYDGTATKVVVYDDLDDVTAALQ